MRFEVRGSNKGCAVVAYGDREFRFRSGEKEGLRALIEQIHRRIIDEDTYAGKMRVIEEALEVLEWFAEHHKELDRMTSAELSMAEDTGNPLFIVGRIEEEWISRTVEEARESITKIKRLEKEATKESDRRILRQMKGALNEVVRMLAYEESRGVDRRAGYQREVLVAGNMMDKIFSRVDKRFVRLEMKQEIEEAFKKAGLSKREREVYELHHGSMMTRAEIAEMLGISLGTVQKALARAKEKIKRWRGKVNAS
jgi:RNA polymerase sigma factor (sigma-70 family)